METYTYMLTHTDTYTHMLIHSQAHAHTQYSQPHTTAFLKPN